MGYLPQTEADKRVGKLKSLLKEKNLDLALGVLRRVQHRQRMVSDRMVPRSSSPGRVLVTSPRGQAMILGRADGERALRQAGQRHQGHQELPGVHGARRGSTPTPQSSISRNCSRS